MGLGYPLCVFASKGCAGQERRQTIARRCRVYCLHHQKHPVHAKVPLAYHEERYPD